LHNAEDNNQGKGTHFQEKYFAQNMGMKIYAPTDCKGTNLLPKRISFLKNSAQCD
jgi:hypothetical protein